MKPTVIAVCGKGGVGKTTISAILAVMLSYRHRQKALIVDGDHAAGLSMALGITPQCTLNDLRLETIERIKREGGNKKDIALSVDYLLMEALTERGNLAFLPIGRPEEVGCYCSVNGLLRQALELLAAQFEVTLIDAEAGIEQINRQVMRNVDFLLLVSDSSAKGLRVAEQIADVARKTNELCASGIVLNRLRSEEEFAAIKSKVCMPLLGWLPEDEIVRRFDADELPFFDLPACKAAMALAEIIQRSPIAKVFSD